MEFKISEVSNSLRGKIQHKIDGKTKPRGSLGILEKIALQISLIQNTEAPELKKPAIIIFAADHGIADSGVSAYPRQVTSQMVFNFLNGGAAINVFCRQNNINIKIVDAGVDYDFAGNSGLLNSKIFRGTKNFLAEPAMTESECNKAIFKGAEIVQKTYNDGSNIIGFGEMGIGNTSSASVIMSLICDLPLKDCVGKGAGLNEEGVKKKIDILNEAIKKHKDNVKRPQSVLSIFGGFEIAMICGAILKAAELKMVIIIDGFIVTSALLIATELYGNVKDYCIFAHQSGEHGHKLMLEKLQAEPLLNLNMRLGEGSGAAVCYPIINSAVNFLNEMASFESAGVSKKNA